MFQLVTSTTGGNYPVSMGPSWPTYPNHLSYCTIFEATRALDYSFHQHVRKDREDHIKMNFSTVHSEQVVPAPPLGSHLPSPATSQESC